MKAFKTLVLVKSLAAAAIATTSLVAPAISHASPDDGMVCRSGYSGTFDGGRFKCSKSRIINVALECTNLRFPTKVIRAPGAPGDTSGGKDLCTRPGINIGTTDALTGLVNGQDFVFAAVNTNTVNTAVSNADQSEAANIPGLTAADVDTQAGQPNIVVNGGFGSNDVARVTLTLFTFPIPVLSLTLPLPNLSPVVTLPSPRFP